MKSLATVYKIGIGVTALAFMVGMGAAYATKDTDKSSKEWFDGLKKRPDLYISDLVGSAITWPLFWTNVLFKAREKHTR